MKSRITNANTLAVIQQTVGIALTSIEEKIASEREEASVVQVLEQIIANKCDEKNMPDECLGDIRKVRELLVHSHPQNRALNNPDVEYFLKNNMSAYEAIALYQKQLSKHQKQDVVNETLAECKAIHIKASPDLIETLLACSSAEALTRSIILLTSAHPEDDGFKYAIKTVIYQVYMRDHAVYRLDGSKPIGIDNIAREPRGILAISQFDTEEQKITATDVKNAITAMVTEKIAKWKEFISLKKAFKALTPPATDALNLVTQMKACAIENISDLSAAGGLTPLHVAVAEGSKELVAWCIERNIDPHAAVRIDYTKEIRQNMTAFTLAGSKKNCSELTDLLNIPALQIAAQESFKELPIDRFALLGKKRLDELQSCKATISGLKTVAGFSPLHIAVIAGTVDDIHWCLENTENSINIKDDGGHTPLFYAKNKAIADVLLSRGALVDIQPPHGITLLHSMIDSKCDIEVIRAIISRTREKIDIEDHAQKTPLYHAIEHQYYEAAQLLLFKYSPSMRVEKEKELAKKSGNQKLIQLFDAHAARQEFSKLSHLDTNDKIVSSLDALKPYLTNEMIHQLRTTADELSLLHMAAMVGHLELVETCLKAGMNKDTVCKTWGSTPLMFFAQRVPIPADPRTVESIARLLLESGDEVNYTNHYNSTALHFAVTAKKLPLVRILLSYPHTDTNIATNEDKLTAHSIASTSSHPGIRRLFTIKAKIEADEKPSTETLHDLAGKGDMDGIEKTLQANRELLNIKDDQGNTALHIAVMMEQAEAAKRLLWYGSAHQINHNGESAYDIAVAIGNQELLALFKEQDEAAQGIKKLNYEENSQIIKIFLEKIAGYLTPKMVQTLKTDDCKSSLLHLALIAGDPQKVKQCLTLKADTNVRDKFDDTPLISFACSHQTPPEVTQTIIHLLLGDKSIDINAVNKFGLTALHFAVDKKNLPLVRALLIAGARTDMESTRDWSQKSDIVIPVKSTACGKNQTNPSILYLFEKYKIEPTETDEKPSPETLHDLAERGSKRRILEMLKNNPELLNAKDKQGNTALHVAVMMRQTKVVSFLARLEDAELYSRNNKGKTPYEIAYLTNNNQLMTLFPAHEHVSNYENLKRKDIVNVKQVVENILEYAEENLLGDFVYSLVTKDEGWTLLHWAAITKDMELFRKVWEIPIKQGKLNPKAQDKDGRTAEYYATLAMREYMATAQKNNEFRIFKIRPVVKNINEEKPELSPIPSLTQR